MEKKTLFNGIRSIGNPCYNPKTGDCPDRSPTCAATCEKWKKHKEQRKKVYEERIKQANDTIVYNAIRKTKGRDRNYGGG